MDSYAFRRVTRTGIRVQRSNAFVELSTMDRALTVQKQPVKGHWIFLTMDLFDAETVTSNGMETHNTIARLNRTQKIVNSYYLDKCFQKTYLFSIVDVRIKRMI